LRLLTTLCLLKNGYEFMQYILFENHIELLMREKDFILLRIVDQVCLIV
jgi:hypothetical protein